MKAENAVPFVPGMDYCRIVERHSDGLTRDVSFRGQPMRERITFAEPVRFDRMDSAAATWVTNTVSDSDDGLLHVGHRHVVVADDGQLPGHAQACWRRASPCCCVP